MGGWTKKALEQLALDVRAEIGSDIHGPLNLARLADEYGIPIYPLSDLGAHGCSPEALNYFAGPGAKSWSAALVPVGTSRFIVENSAHSLQRRRSNVAHEFGHLLLEHEFDRILFTDGECRNVNDTAARTREEQALALSAELLIPKKAAIKAALAGKTDSEVAEQFDVSIEFARMRMNPSGARTIAQRIITKQQMGDGRVGRFG
ncbi:ImmA/IrrE family metallo-endopeptidase [Streptomyces sp. JNUCC 63]